MRKRAGPDPIVISRPHASLARARHRPPSMDAIEITPEQRELLDRQSLEIFAEMTSWGWSFQDALSAVLMTGLAWGAQVAGGGTLGPADDVTPEIPG